MRQIIPLKLCLEMRNIETNTGGMIRIWLATLRFITSLGAITSPAFRNLKSELVVLASRNLCIYQHFIK
jgi:hypothetical protein